MILFENSIVRMDYEPATDICLVAYPDLHGYLLPEIKHTIDALVTVIKSYDVKRLLLDSSKTIVSVGQEESRQVSLYLAAGLVQTRLEKVARLQSQSEVVETTAEKNIQQVQQVHQLPFLLRNFSNKQDAMEWLKQPAKAS